MARSTQRKRLGARAAPAARTCLSPSSALRRFSCVPHTLAASCGPSCAERMKSFWPENGSMGRRGAGRCVHENVRQGGERWASGLGAWEPPGAWGGSGRHAAAPDSLRSISAAFRRSSSRLLLKPRGKAMACRRGGAEGRGQGGGGRHAWQAVLSSLQTTACWARALAGSVLAQRRRRSAGGGLRHDCGAGGTVQSSAGAHLVILGEGALPAVHHRQRAVGGGRVLNEGARQQQRLHLAALGRAVGARTWQR